MEEEEEEETVKEMVKVMMKEMIEIAWSKRSRERAVKRKRITFRSFLVWWLREL